MEFLLVYLFINKRDSLVKNEEEKENYTSMRYWIVYKTTVKWTHKLVATTPPILTRYDLWSQKELSKLCDIKTCFFSPSLNFWGGAKGKVGQRAFQGLNLFDHGTSPVRWITDSIGIYEFVRLLAFPRDNPLFDSVNRERETPANADKLSQISTKFLPLWRQTSTRTFKLNFWWIPALGRVMK